MVWAMRAALRYGLAIAAVAVVLGLKLALVPWVEHDTPFLLFFAAVLVASWFGGLGPGLLAVVISAAASAYFFMRPYDDFRIADPVMRLRVAMFMGEGVFVSVLAAVLQSTQRRARQAMADARRLERSILEASEAERRQIGHDLHEGLGQQLAGAAFRANLLSRRLAAHGNGTAEAADDAKAIEELLNHSVEWTRDLAAGLSPVRLRQDGLAAALEELADRTARESKTPCVFEGDERSAGLQPEAATQLFHIAREALGEALRHAQPSRIVIGLITPAGGDERAVVMTVRSDASGTGVAAGDQDGGALRTMEYRARLAGARLVLKRLKPAGTELICTCPLDQPRNVDEGRGDDH
jgi:signal transduction histidine kinase